MDESITSPAASPLFSKPMRILAQVVSYIAHPLFIPGIVVAILLFQHPINSILLPYGMRIRLMGMVLYNTLFLPMLVMLLLYKLKFLKSMYMETQRERIIPLNIVIIFYFWAFYVGRNLEGIPSAFQQWLLGVFLGSCVAMFVNIFKQISLHTVGMGGFVTFCIWQQATDPHWPAGWLMIGLLAAGLVGTARLIRQAHEPSEIYAGYLAGALCQVAAGLVIT